MHVPPAPRPRPGRVLGRLWLALALLAIAAFVGCGFYGLTLARSRRVQGAGVLSSTDRFLLEALHVPGGGEKILDAIAGLPPAGPLAIIGPVENVYTSLLLQIIGSFTWPHPVYLIQVRDGSLAAIPAVLKDHHFAAALFFDVAPPISDAGQRQVGLLTIVPLSK